MEEEHQGRVSLLPEVRFPGIMGIKSKKTVF
jgi:hypothetical protein